MHTDRRVHTDSSPDGSAWAAFRTAEFPTIAEHNPAVVQWGDLRLDPDLAGLAIDRARPAVVELGSRESDETWALPIAGVLQTRLAWHASRPLVAGLADHGAGPRLWIADYRTRTVEIREQVRAATSLTSMSHPARGPLAWIDESRLAVLTVPSMVSNDQDYAQPVRPIVYEAAGPGFVAFEPDFTRLGELAGATVSMVDPDCESTTSLTEALLIRGIEGSAGVVLVEYLDESTTAGRTPADFCWSARSVDAAGRSRPTTMPPRPRPTPPQEVRHDSPECVVEMPTGWDNARLAIWASAEREAQLLWVRVRRPGGAAPPLTRSDALGGCVGATLDLPLHWPAEATLDMLRTQIERAIQGSVDVLANSSAVVIGGHSFGATIALYALATVPGLAGGIAHSGCYNRTLTPTGFQYERRPYWHIPDIYHAFSALLFADRIEQPVLIVHGTDDANPSTTPDQAVQLYQGVVAAGGQARLVLLPYEGHSIRYRESREALFEEHRAWLARCGPRSQLVHLPGVTRSAYAV